MEVIVSMLRDSRDFMAMSIGPSKFEMIIIFNNIISCSSAHPGSDIFQHTAHHALFRISHGLIESLRFTFARHVCWRITDDAVRIEDHLGGHVLLVRRDGECGVILLPKSLRYVGEDGRGIQVQTRGRRGIISDAAGELHVK